MDLSPHEPISTPIPSRDDAKHAFTQLCTGLLVLTLVYQTAAGAGMFIVSFVRTLTALFVTGSDPELLMDTVTAAAADPTLLMVINDLALYGIAVPLLWLIVRRLPTAHTEEPLRLSSRWLLRCTVICVGGLYVFSVFGTYLSQAVELLGGSPTAATESLAGIPLWALFFFICVIAPIGEEFIFRKLLFDRALVFGELGVVVFTATAFGLFHGNLEQFFYTTALGFVLGYVTLRTRDLRYAIFLHFAANLFGGFLPSVLAFSLPLSGLYLLAMLIVCSFAAFFAITSVRHVHFAPSPCLPTQGLLRFIWGNPTGIIFFSLSCLTALIYLVTMFIVV